jgi:AraC-like DNA-binding protein
VFDGAIEIVVAAPAARSFPTRVSEGLGVCLKLGNAHTVQCDGRALTYPADAICVRYPGCVWSCEITRVGFVSIDIAPSLLPRGFATGPMRFLRPSPRLDLRALARRLEDASSTLAQEEALAELCTSLHASGALSAAELEQDPPQAVVLRRAREFLAATLAENANLDELAAATQTNKFVLIRYFRKKLGTTPHHYLLQLRIERARNLLARGAAPAEVAAAVGFADQGHFGRHFKRAVGMPPGEYARLVRASSAVSARRPVRGDAADGQFRSRRVHREGA